MPIRHRRIWTSLTAATAAMPVAMGAPVDAGLPFGLGVSPAFAQQGGEGGEGGEAGATAPANDPAALAIALDGLAAYAQAGLAAYAAGQPEVAAELLKETETAFEGTVGPVIADDAGDALENRLETAADLAEDKGAADAVASAGEAALAEIARTRKSIVGGAPAPGNVEARAFLEALNHGALELSAAAKDPEDRAAYFEAYGYLRTAEAHRDPALAALDAIGVETGAKARAALAALAKAVPGPTPPAILDADPGEVLAAVSSAMLAAGTL
ncbi:MAG: hypothetical protein R3D57_07610 [Hyphomicrobiaceae bacterium]